MISSHSRTSVKKRDSQQNAKMLPSKKLSRDFIFQLHMGAFHLESGRFGEIKVCRGDI